ncbi:hypothetical protein evm_014072 [Chilo suppressalis]|nr:hypothetical protein evm_014072 [Chilo suppressalis]
MVIKENAKLLSMHWFADDLVLITDNLESLQLMMQELATKSREVGLTINRSKTKVMTNSRGTTVHTFPNPNKFLERFKEWVQIIGGKLETPSDYEFYKKKRICDVHFIEQHKTSCHRLSALAVPSLYLPGSTDIQQRSPIIANTSMSIPNQSDEPTMTDNQPTLVNNLSTAPSTSDNI